MKNIKLGDKEIGAGCPVYIVAEIGFNHGGDIDLGQRMIEKAAEAGVDAVKFQTFKASDLVCEDTEHFNIIKRCELSEDDHKKLAAAAKDNDVAFLSTPFSNQSVDMLEKINVSGYKVASMDVTNLPFLQYIASFGKPMIISTGMATIAEILEAINSVRDVGNDQIVLLHCISKYPAVTKEANLRNIPYLRETCDLPVGFSDHVVRNTTSFAAVALDACLIEKHFTVDKTLPGPDHNLSSDYKEMTELVQGIRTIEQSMGKLFNTIERPDRKEATMFRRSIHSKIDIKKGTIINSEMIKCVRPGNGLSPKYIDLVLGRTAKDDIPKNTRISLNHI